MKCICRLVGLAILYTGIVCAATGVSVSTEIITEETDVPASIIATGNLQYVCAPGHVSFIIPDQWRVISESELEPYKRKLGEAFPDRPVPNYIMGMQRKSLFTFSLPYMLVVLEKGTMPTLEEIQAEKVSYVSSIQQAYLSLHRKGMFGEVKALPAEYYPERKVLLGYSEMTRASDNVRLVAITASYPCQYGYLRLNFFINAEQSDRDMPAIDEIISSVSFEPEYAYIPYRKDMSSEQLRYILYGIVGVLACAWFFIRIFGSRIRRKEPYRR